MVTLSKGLGALGVNGTFILKEARDEFVMTAAFEKYEAVFGRRWQMLESLREDADLWVLTP